jgi:hypothetical protein
MRVGIRSVDGDGALEAGDGVGVLTPLLIDKSELVVRVGVARIVGGDLKLIAQMLARAKAVAEALYTGEKAPLCFQKPWVFRRRST